MVDEQSIESWKAELARSLNRRLDIRRMIGEWRRGCSCSGQLPSFESAPVCDKCTRALIDAIEKRNAEG